MVESQLLPLLPIPRSRHASGGLYAPVADAGISAPDGSDARIAHALGRSLAALGRLGPAPHRRPHPPSGAGLCLEIDASIGGPEAYRLCVMAERIELVGASPIGLLHGSATLLQLCQRDSPLPRQEIHDAPQLAERGVMLDISRDRVPTMAHLRQLIDTLAGWKINQLQLYIEHTFAYPQHPVVWADASPMTGEEIREIDQFCAARGIELLPNLNTLGHMERWLKHGSYRHLAECPDGFVDPWGCARDVGSTLCPTDPGSLELVRGMLSEYLSHFSSSRVNIGGDEPFELGQGRSKGQDSRALYLGWLSSIHRLIAPRQMRCWGDVILDQPACVSQLPEDVVVVAWGYEADHPFERDTAHFAEAGVPVVLAPGTSTWNAICGRTDVAQRNLAAAAKAAHRQGALGLLITDWGDHGHWQHPVFSDLPFALGAALAWNGRKEVPLAAVLDRTHFAEPLAETIAALGRVSPLTGVAPANAAFLCRILQQPSDPLPEELSAEGVDQALALIDELLPAAARDADVLAGAKLLRHGARFAQARLEGMGSRARRELRADLHACIDQQRRRWLMSSRPGGLADSLARLHALEEHYRP